MNRKFKLKKKIKRKPDKKSKLYFHAGTQQAIVNYQKSDDIQEKKDLYIKEISPAFNELVENLIFVFGFTSQYDTTEDLKHDCVAFLYEQIGKFDHTRGFKAFSYFSIIAKNFLIIRSNKKSANIKKNLSLDDSENLSTEDVEEIEDRCTLQPDVFDYEYKENKNINIEKLFGEIKSKAKTEGEILCIEAIIAIFRNLDNIDFLNKRAFFQYVKDYTGLNGKQMTASMSMVKKYYRESFPSLSLKIFNN